MYKRKSWQEKLDSDKGLPKVVKIDGKLSTRWGTGTVVIPKPREVYEIMNKVPKGKLITINEIRKIVAKKHHATIGCPITCGIFVWVSANAGVDKIPFWRTLKSDGSLNEKYPGEIKLQKERLTQERHEVTQKGKKYFVVDFEKSLWKIK